MKSTLRSLVSSGLLFASLCVVLPAAHALAVTSNSLTISNIRITPSAGTLTMDSEGNRYPNIPYKVSVPIGESGSDGGFAGPTIYACWAKKYNDVIFEKNRVPNSFATEKCEDTSGFAEHFNANFDKLKTFMAAMCACEACKGKVVLHLYFGAWGAKDDFWVKTEQKTGLTRIYENWGKK